MMVTPQMLEGDPRLAELVRYPIRSPRYPAIGKTTRLNNDNSGEGGRHPSLGQLRMYMAPDDDLVH